MDCVTVRRALVDARYLLRANGGSGYQVAATESRPGLFDEAINQLNIPEVIAAAREEIAKRKQTYLEKAKKS